MSPNEADDPHQTLGDLEYAGGEVHNQRTQGTGDRVAQRGRQDSVCVFIDIHGVELGFNDTFRTESYDHMEPVGVDPRWDAFGPFHDYLFESFPLVCAFLRIRVNLPFDYPRLCLRSHSTLSLTKVNTWGMIYVWDGSDENLKPALFTGHQGTFHDSFVET